ncbi:hypothetical protein FRB96_008423 [Tulasnella sp. 330]|nr:hypothetical protein FRB96_008423 [Tulasnella sp. 330]
MAFAMSCLIYRKTIPDVLIDVYTKVRALKTAIRRDANPDLNHIAVSDLHDRQAATTSIQDPDKAIANFHIIVELPAIQAAGFRRRDSSGIRDDDGKRTKLEHSSSMGAGSARMFTSTPHDGNDPHFPPFRALSSRLWRKGSEGFLQTVKGETTDFPIFINDNAIPTQLASFTGSTANVDHRLFQWYLKILLRDEYAAIYESIGKHRQGASDAAIAVIGQLGIGE